MTTPATTDTRPSARDVVLVAAFLLVVGLPGLLTPVADSASALARNGEAPVARPSFPGAQGMGPWLRQVQDYLRVSFGMRQLMISLDARLKATLALSSSYGSAVTSGRDGWLFYRVHRGTQGVRPELPFSEGELEAWASSLEAKGRSLEERGIPFVLVVAPNKDSIYPDMLPPELPAARPRSRLDALTERLTRGGKVRVVDVRPALLAARLPPSPLAPWPLFFRTDTHWNELGGLVAARQVLGSLNDLFPGIWTPADDALELTSEQTSGGDIARMQGLQWQVSDVRLTVDVRGAPCLFDLPRTPRGQSPETPIVGERTLSCPRAPIPRGLILHDSMMTAMAPTLASAFQVSTWRFASSLDLALVDREKPSVVILEFVERTLWEASSG